MKFPPISKHLTALIAEKLVRLLTNLFLISYVARYLGPENLGILSYAQSFLVFFAAIATLGLDSILIKRLVRNSKYQLSVLRSGFILKAIGATIAFTLTVLLYISINDLSNFTVFLIVCLTILVHPFSVAELWLQANSLHPILAKGAFFQFAVSSILRSAGVLFQFDLFYFAIILLLDVLLLQLFYLVFFIRMKHPENAFFSARASKRQMSAYLSAGVPLIFTAAAVSLYMRLDQIMIEFFLGVESVGIYALAIRYVEVIYFIPVIVGKVTFPVFLEARSFNQDELYDKIQRTYDILFIISFTLASLLFTTGKPLTDIIGGVQYSAASGVFSIYGWVLVFVFWGVVSSNFQVQEDKQKYLAIKTYLGLASNFILNLFLIPSFGVTGAAWATLISYAVSVYFSSLLFNATRQDFIFMTRAIFPFHRLLQYVR